MYLGELAFTPSTHLSWSHFVTMGECQFMKHEIILKQSHVS